MHPTVRTLLVTAGAAALGSAVLAGCGSSGPSAAGRSAHARTTTTTTTTAPASSTSTTSRPTTTTSGAVPVTSSTTSPRPDLAPPPVPSGQIYLGAWVNPAGKKTGGGLQQMAQVPAFQQQVGRPLAILHLYAGFRQPVPLGQLTAITDNGSLPMLDWGCAPPAQVVSGADDGIITAYAQSLKSFGHPVLLRWFWEMNLPSTAKRCQVTDPATFVAAWRHVWTLFRQAGATNVSFVWCPGISAGLSTFAPLYPGSQYVNWIGVDGYDRTGLGAQGFSALFGAWYTQWATQGLPLMIGETGAHPAVQAAYLNGVRQQLPTTYPAIKAFVYFDAPGPAGQWALSGSGLTAFARMAADPYFSARA